MQCPINTGFDVTGPRNRQRSLFQGAILYRRVLASRIFNHRTFHPLSDEIVLVVLVKLNAEETLQVMADGEKLNVDSIIARLLEGWFPRCRLIRYSNLKFVRFWNYLLRCSSRFKTRKECTTYRGRNQRAMFKIARNIFKPTDPSGTGSSAQNLR